MEVPFNEISEEEQRFVNNLCRYSIFDVVRYNKINNLINDSTYNDKEDYFIIVKDAYDYLEYNCNLRCLIKTINSQFHCRKLNYLEFSKENTKYTFKEFNNEIPKDFLYKLVKIRIVQSFQSNEYSYMKK